jgi:hypothetical protein
MLAASKGGSGGGDDNGGGWESTGEPPSALGKMSASDDGSTLVALKHGGGMPWM